MLTALMLLKLGMKIAAYVGLILAHWPRLPSWVGSHHHRHLLTAACYLGLMLGLLLEQGIGPMSDGSSPRAVDDVPLLASRLRNRPEEVRHDG